MEDKMSLSESMEQTIEYGNFEFVGDIGEIMMDAALNDGILKEIPILGTVVGVVKCIKNTYDAFFAKKLIAFLIPIKDVSPKVRENAIRKWQEDKNYRGKVGDTLLGMIQRCDDAIKAGWLSQLFYELVLKRGYSRLFMRAEKTLSALSVMDVQAFLNIPSVHYNRIGEEECEPFLGSGLYLSPKIDGTVVDGRLDMDSKHCEITEIGYWIYNVLNGLSVTEVEQNELL